MTSLFHCLLSPSLPPTFRFCCDYLSIGSTDFRGFAGAPHNAPIRAGETITWRADQSIQGGGFLACGTLAAYTAFPPPSPSPPPPNPGPPPIPPGMAPPAVYSIHTIGGCGVNNVRDAEECEQAAEALGLSDITVTIDSQEVREGAWTPPCTAVCADCDPSAL